MTAHDIRRVLVLVLVLFGGAAAPAWAQPAPQVPVRLTAGDPFLGIKKQVSFTFSGGFDLDVVGNVVNGSLGSRGDAQVAIRTALPWPDIYQSVPKRPELTIGFGFAQKDEVILRLSRATYGASTTGNIGNFVDLNGEQALTLAVSPYKEQSWEIGLRRYMMMTQRAKQYVNLVYGNRIIEPIEAVFQLGNQGVSMGTFRLYDRTTAKTFGLEMGLTLERGRAGAFAQVGARFVRRMKRDDEDLATWNLQFVNNTGVRFYMPLQFGLLFRL